MTNKLSSIMNKKGLSNIFAVAGIVAVILLASLFLLYNNVGASGNVVYTPSSNTPQGNVQVVKIHVEGSQYIMEPAVLKVGVPVRFVADMANMPGCSKSISISDFGVRKTFSSFSDYVEFTPNKAGTFYIACSMNMYKGTFEVVNSDGTKSNYVQSAPAGGHTCGASGGGCGCGG
ncbi:Uncharacterised protein [uncultured archaeon]|nr:Uncharacterised protein [uncultured archaeon]